MKKILLVCLMTSLVITLHSQEDASPRQKEFGVAFASLNSFGLVYKTGTKDAMWRFNSLIMSAIDENMQAQSIDSNFKNTTSYGFSFGLGREHRKAFADKLEFRYGVDLSFSYYYNKSEESRDGNGNNSNYYLTERTTYSPGLHFVIGLNYVMKNNLVFGIELRPGFRYTMGEETINNYYNSPAGPVKSDISGYSFGLRNGRALLSVSYRFLK